MLFAVPFGALADRYGRKKILLLACFGMFMNDAWIRLVCELVMLYQCAQIC